MGAPTTITYCLALLALLPISAHAQPGNDSQPRSLTVEQAVQVGLRSNPELHAMDAEVRMATAETGMARAMTRFQVSTTTYLGTGTMPNILSTSPGVQPTNNNLVPKQSFVTQNVTLMAPLYTGGRLSGTVRAAQAQEQATTEDRKEMRLQVALMVREAYFQSLLAEEMVKTAQARLDAADALLAVTRALFEVGKGIQASVQRVEAERAEALGMLQKAQNDVARMLLELREAMGISLDTPLTLTDGLAAPQSVADLNAALRQAREQRPLLHAFRLRLAASRARKSSAQGAFRPQVYVGAMADAVRSREMGTETGYTVGATISLPLLDGGQRRAEGNRALAEEDRAAATLRSAEQRVEREVRIAYVNIDTARQNRQSAEAGLLAAQAAYEVVALRVQNQKAILVEQLEALASVTQARVALARARFDFAISEAQLRRACGIESEGQKP